jgi:hypothetical protein
MSSVPQLYLVQPQPPTLEIAAEINAQYRLARANAATAVEHAIACGQLLGEQKKIVGRGWAKWLAQHCSEIAYSTAHRYIKAAEQISTGVEISSLSALFPSGRRSAADECDGDKVNIEKALAILESVRRCPERAQYQKLKTEARRLQRQANEAKSAQLQAELPVIQAALARRATAAA